MSVRLPELKAPFPFFGGKRRVAHLVWPRFGNVLNFVEPFFGSGAVLLGRPRPFGGNETINDIDGYVANAWRSIKHSPDLTAEHADIPVNENDLHAIHVWLLKEAESLVPRLEADPDWHDPKIAGRWIWGISTWIGSGFCSGNGAWQVVDGKLQKGEPTRNGIVRGLPSLGGRGSRGVNGSNGQGATSRTRILKDWFADLSERLRNVRVISGDWARTCGPSLTYKQNTTAVFLDPPYSDDADRTENVYRKDSTSVAKEVRTWAIENGKRSDMRIAICGYEGEHEMPPDWSVLKWKAQGGYESMKATDKRINVGRERIWFSPACIKENPFGAYAPQVVLNESEDLEPDDED